MKTGRMNNLLVLAFGMLLASLASGQSANGPASSQVANTAFSADNAPLVPDLSGGWREGRATFYDAPQYFQEVCSHLHTSLYGMR